MSETKVNRGGRPRVDATPITVRLVPADLAALDAHIAAHPEPKPTRPEAIRRVLADGLQRSGSPRGILDEEKASRARKYAGAAADAELGAINAPAEEKARRRKALTDEPASVSKAREKRAI